MVAELEVSILAFEANGYLSIFNYYWSDTFTVSEGSQGRYFVWLGTQIYFSIGDFISSVVHLGGCGEGTVWMSIHYDI